MLFLAVDMSIGTVSLCLAYDSALTCITYGCWTFHYAGPIIWNTLSDELRNSDTFDSFKWFPKRIILSRYKCMWPVTRAHWSYFSNATRYINLRFPPTFLLYLLQVTLAMFKEKNYTFIGLYPGHTPTKVGLLLFIHYWNNGERKVSK